MTPLNSAAASWISFADYKNFHELPFALIDSVNYSVYVINYDWTYRFINKSARTAYGPLAENLIGRSAFDVSGDKRFDQIFFKIKDDVDRKLFLNSIVDSPLRGSKVVLKGYPLNDCYLFSATIVPEKIDVVNELRDELNKRKPKQE